ncbi:hypothetical protein Vadar_031893 [Vaccinium darrowii]|uniref:Uncharacterized protein n=1 Tax=Vaccinium darrowii TaxID=229202 RepID=A0ACB7XLH6_9ERIC|nr:hypothetical protein Vadar_031893 [Vaccinium darrowii]
MQLSSFVAASTLGNSIDIFSCFVLLFRDSFIREGYQFDYVFDWTILKYPQIGAISRGRNPSGSAGLNPGPSVERPERTSGILSSSNLIGSLLVILAAGFAILFLDVMNSQLQDLLEKQGSELKQGKQLIPRLKQQVTSLIGQLQWLAEESYGCEC